MLCVRPLGGDFFAGDPRHLFASRNFQPTKVDNTFKLSP